MRSTKLLLGSTALVAAMFAADAVSAATVQPGGAFDLTLTGRIRTKAFGGDLQAARLNNTVSQGLDFASDARIDVLARARHDATGIEYGGNIQVNVDDAGGEVSNDETWVFMRGGFGEFRMGDDDGPTDNDKVGGFSVGAGTGGIDGSVVDTIALPVVGPSNSGDNTKVIYRTPSLAGFQLVGSYTPNIDGGGDQIAPVDVDQGDWFEGGALYTGAFAGVDILASVVGGVCDIKESDANDSCHTIFGGATVNLFGFKLGGGYGSENISGTQRDWANAGIGAALGPVNVSLTYGIVTDSNDAVVNGNEVGKPQNIVVSADVALMPGLVLQGDVGYFDNDVKEGAAAGTIGDTDDSGYQAVARLALAF